MEDGKKVVGGKVEEVKEVYKGLSHNNRPTSF